MRKKIVQDVISNKKSIQDISIPKRNRASFDVRPKTNTEQSFSNKTTDNFIDARVHIKKEDTPSKKYNFEYDFDKPHKESRKTLYFSVFVFVVALFFGIFSLLSKATVSITLKKDTFPIKQTLTVIKNPQNGEFGYQTINLESSASKQVIEKLSEQKVEQKASGILSVTNESGKIQKLIANTRFESSNGLIYRIKDAVSLPTGKSDVTVFADESGDKYNTPKDTKFTIPGFKNDPKYKTITAISKNDISGGQLGTQKTLDENLKKTLNIELSAELKKNLLSQINSQTPDNFIYYPNTIKYTFKDIEIVDENGSVWAEKKGSIEVVIFDKTLLSQKIIDILKEKNEIILPAEIKNLDSLSVVFTQDSDSIIKMDISGDVLIKSTIDTTLLKNDLIGLRKDSINDLLSSKYPGIKEAKVKISPFWKSNIPIKPEKVIIKEVE